jgi:hypothetical protein
MAGLFDKTIVGKIFNFDKIEAKDPIINRKAFIEPENRDGAVVIEATPQPSGGVLAYNYNIDPNIRNSKDLINQYRMLSMNYEVDRGIEEIVNEAIVTQSDGDQLAKLGMDSCKFSQSIKDKIVEQFNYILQLYKFEYFGDDMFRQWYIDGRQAYHMLIDEKMKTISELRRLDVRYLEKIRLVTKEQVQGIDVVTGYNEYFVYRPGMDDASTSRYYLGKSSTTEIQIPIQAIVYAHSGLKNIDGSIISFLHKTIKPANILRSIEDAAVIYRISRAPERRIFYVGTGNMPKGKAEQYVQGLMNKFKNKITYDTKTGALRTAYDSQSMLEDYWVPRAGSDKSTEITTLKGAENLNEIEDILYFQRGLYNSMSVPPSRFDLQGTDKYSVSKPTEVTRDELKFAKFIKKLQRRFSPIILEPLKMQCILKGICTAQEWDDQSNNIKVIFNTDSYFDELKKSEILLNRVDLYAAMEKFIGTAYSADYVWKYALNMTDEEIETEGKKILAELASGHPRYKRNEQF